MTIQTTGRFAARLATGACAALFAASANAALVQFDFTGTTDNTFVGSGNPCNTGLSGGNACNSQVMTVSWVVDTGNTLPDSQPAANDGYYNATGVPGFVTGTATINGTVFSIPSTVQFNFAQSIQLRNDYFGVDQVIIGVMGGNSNEFFSLGPTLNITGNPFSGDSLDVLTTLPETLPLLNNQAFSTFNFSNAAGQVQGNVVFNQVGVSIVPVPGVAWLFGLGLAATLRWRARAR